MLTSKASSRNRSHTRYEQQVNTFCCQSDETRLYDPFAMVKKTKDSMVWMLNDPLPYTDLVMGYSSTNFGHRNSKILSFVRKAIRKYDNLPAFNSLDKIELSEKILNLLCLNNNYRVYFTVGGAEAVDTAIKLARAYARKKVIVSFDGAFHRVQLWGIVGY